MTTQEKIAALEALTKEMNTPEKCPLFKVAKSVVPGEGNVDTSVMFIGEAPGKNEDEQGRPFVGAAGKLLEQLIESINLKRSDVYIANIIKHRPPGNRDPLPNEIAAYAPWLKEQIKIINPPLIVTLGRFSMDYLLGAGFSITKIHGQPKRLPDLPTGQAGGGQGANGRVVMPLHHPAAALYRGDLRPVLAADFQKIPKVLQLIEQGKMGPEKAEVKTEVQQKTLF